MKPYQMVLRMTSGAALRYSRPMTNVERRHPERFEVYILVMQARRLGWLRRQPCEVCGEALTDAHHDDYSKPLAVRWLCRVHHRRHHAARRAA